MVGLLTKNLSVLPADAPLRVEEVPGGVRVSVPAGARASIVERYDPQGTAPYVTQTKVFASVAENAHLNHYKLVHEGRQADHSSFLEVDVQKAGSFHSEVFLFEGARIRNTIHVRLVGEEASCILNGLYVGSGRQEFETHTLIEHQKPRGTSRELYKGILDDQSRGLFDGLIVVQKEAQKTDSSQTNKNLLLSPEAHASANPELKILANDVKCKHGATIGQLNADALFYLRSRGVPAPEARRLLVYAFASEMIEPVQVPELREALFPCLNLATSIKKSS
jgi:Fe-S cluster assembly protein SufD